MEFVFWKVLKRSSELEHQIEKDLGFNNLVSKVLAARFKTLNLVDESMKSCELESPFAMLNMNTAVAHLKEAAFAGKKIVVYGDYDCDGVCASAIMFSYLKNRFNANVSCYIPKRSEGYGLNVDAIKNLKQAGANLILTVDNGIKSVEEAKLISSLGMDLIITDHHNVANELPKAVAILNPKQPGDGSKFKEICGAVVVLKLIAAMEGGNLNFAFDFAGDLAAIATVADLVPLVSENRKVVLKGLLKLESSANFGLVQLFKLVFPSNVKKFNSTQLAFKVCPLINAAGRIKSANLAFELLTCESVELAKQKAANLVQINSLRKQLQVELMNKAFEFIKQNVNCLRLPVLVVYGQKWQSGLIGLVAGGLLSRFKKPVVVLAIDNGIAVGSARSFESFKIFDALKFCSNLFLKWGGHDFAGGLTMNAEYINKFIFKINEFAKLKIFSFVHQVDLTASLKSVNLNFARALQELEPFGKLNEQPIILFKNLKLLKIVSLKQGAHLRLEFEQNGVKASFLAFNFAFNSFYYEIGCEFNVIAHVEINNFLGRESLSLILIDLRPASFNQFELLQSFKLLKNLEQGKNLNGAQFQKFKPDRSNFELIYLKLKKIKVFRGSFFQFFCLFCEKISCFKLFVVLQVFLELGLAEFDGFELNLKNLKNKTNLESSEFLKKWFG